LYKKKRPWRHRFNRFNRLRHFDKTGRPEPAQNADRPVNQSNRPEQPTVLPMYVTDEEMASKYRVDDWDEPPQ